MRRAQKALLLDLVHTLAEAHGVIGRLAATQSTGHVKALLADCQNTAIQMGSLIEQSEGEDCATVRLLEDYCDALFQVYENAGGGSPVHQVLDAPLRQIEHSVKHDLKMRLEVAFFPYQASMWDSLESVWRAAAADPDCDAYVVPIPYYEIRPDGSLGELHCDSGAYPPYVPLVDWRTYSLEERRPDAAFIHNPYDDQNQVTQVLSTYFSCNLKQHVGILCYIPYFIAAGTVSSHFACRPAVLNSDFTIVESEDVRQQYLSVWRDLMEQGLAQADDLAAMEEKIQPLGSPKLDAVAAAARNDVSIPDRWRRLIVRPDGTRRRVIFYNTSISAMLRHTMDEDGCPSPRYLDKLESVFRFFRHREDAVLLWRPHPLLGPALASMRPQLYQRYTQLLQDYRRDGYGIYDDSADLNRAISTSDAYYGDGSSVMSLWKRTGKPLLIEDCSMLSGARRLGTESFYFDGAFFWFTSKDFNGLFRMEKDSLQIQYMGAFPHEPDEQVYLFKRAAECNGKLFFAPYTAGSVGVYDKSTQTFSQVPLEPLKNSRVQAGRYVEGHACGGFVYLAAGTRVPLLQINADTNEATVAAEWDPQLLPHRGEGTPDFGRSYCKGRDIYIPSNHANGMFVFHTDSGRMELHPFQGDSRSYDLGVLEGNEIWLCSSSNSSVGIYDIETSRLTELIHHFDFRGIRSIEAYHGSIFCFSIASSRILKIDGATRQIQQLPADRPYFPTALAGRFVYAMSPSSDTITKINLETLEQTAAEPGWREHLPDTDCHRLMEASEAEWGNPHETCYLNLDVLIDAANTPPREQQDAEECGAGIYQFIKERLT